MKTILRILIFLVINFGGLYIGNILMNNGPRTDWYMTLNKAPWTPPGWVFGAAWTLIMICFSLYLGLFTDFKKKLKFLFIISLSLNISWNWFFFNQHLVLAGLIILILLIITKFLFLVLINHRKNIYKALLLPYIIWLSIAISLNGYVLFYN